MHPVVATGSRAWHGWQSGVWQNGRARRWRRSVITSESAFSRPRRAPTATTAPTTKLNLAGSASFGEPAILGFSLDQVRELLGLTDERDRSCEAVDQIARQHLAEVERKIADLTALRDELTDLIHRCRRGTIAECRIIETLAPAF